MTVYVVTSGEYSDYSICAIFSTKELAQAHVDKGGGDTIEEYELDVDKDLVKRTKYVSVVRLLDGKVKQSWNNDELTQPGQEADNPNHTLRFDKRKDGTTAVGGEMVASSYVSQEHADKMAAEKRQAALRTIGGVANLIDNDPRGYWLTLKEWNEVESPR